MCYFDEFLRESLFVSEGWDGLAETGNPLLWFDIENVEIPQKCLIIGSFCTSFLNFFLGVDPHSPSMYYFRQLIKFMLIPRLPIQCFWFASNLHVALDSTINYTTQFLNLVYNPHSPTTFLCLMKLLAKALSKINH